MSLLDRFRRDAWPGEDLPLPPDWECIARAIREEPLPAPRAELGARIAARVAADARPRRPRRRLAPEPLAGAAMTALVILVVVPLLSDPAMGPSEPVLDRSAAASPAARPVPSAPLALPAPGSLRSVAPPVEGAAADDGMAMSSGDEVMAVEMMTLAAEDMAGVPEAGAMAPQAAGLTKDAAPLDAVSAPRDAPEASPSPSPSPAASPVAWLGMRRR